MYHHFESTFLEPVSSSRHGEQFVPQIADVNLVTHFFEQLQLSHEPLVRAHALTTLTYTLQSFFHCQLVLRHQVGYHHCAAS